MSLGRRFRCHSRPQGVRRSDRRRCRCPRPTKIVGPPPLRVKRFAATAATEHARHKRIGGCRARSPLGAQQFVTAASRNRQRNDGAGERTGVCTAAKRSRLQWQCDGRRPIGKRAQDFPFHIMSKLAGSEPSEIDPIARAQPPDLTFEVRPLRRIREGLGGIGSVVLRARWRADKRSEEGTLCFSDRDQADLREPRSILPQQTRRSQFGAARLPGRSPPPGPKRRGGFTLR